MLDKSRAYTQLRRIHALDCIRSVVIEQNNTNADGKYSVATHNANVENVNDALAKIISTRSPNDTSPSPETVFGSLLFGGECLKPAEITIDENSSLIDLIWFISDRVCRVCEDCPYPEFIDFGNSLENALKELIDDKKELFEQFVGNTIVLISEISKITAPVGFSEEDDAIRELYKEKSNDSEEGTASEPASDNESGTDNEHD